MKTVAHKHNKWKMFSQVNLYEENDNVTVGEKIEP